MKLHECQLFEQSFTHISDDGEVHVWNTTRLSKWCASTNHEVSLVALLAKQIEYIRDHHSVDTEYLKRLRYDCLRDPVLFLEFKNNSFVLADGNHRAVYAYLRGKRRIRAYLVKQRDWEPFVIEFPPGTDMKEIGEFGMSEMVR